MSFRVSALVSAVAVLALAEFAPVSAQPQVPVRPRYSGFQSVFGGGRPLQANPGQGFLGANQPIGNPNGPLAPGFVLPGQVPGQLGYPYALPGTYGVDPNLPQTGIVGSFNNLGHWYGGNYGHWYPGGVSNGRGITGYGGGNLGGGTVGGGVMMGGGRGGPGLLNTGLTAGATINQFRR